MNAGQQNKCNQCLSTFTSLKLPFKMPNCPHNICSKCLEEIRSENHNVIHCEFCHNSIGEALSKKLQPNKQLRDKVLMKAAKSPRKGSTSNTQN